MFRKVLIANRGEIAVRIIRALKDLGVQSVAVYSDADRASLAVSLADEAAHLGPSPSSESYLHIDKIIDAARRHGADAIHPGYGFLSENAEFADACTDAGIVFVGPPAEAIRKMGSKVEARKLAIAAGAPVVPGTEKPVGSVEEARTTARQLGYPLLIKASAGGGGKGMRAVHREQDLAGALRDAASEAGRAFRSSEVYLEKMLVEPRHIEIQVLGDQHGSLIHLGERECSIQRRHQKVIEECPSPVMLSRPDLRTRMGEAALRIAREASYANAGTLEFLVDRELNFYFLEMNTRLQVEHPVTELVTGLDLVNWQLRIAAGEPLTLAQETVEWRGSAIECRIYAEDPDNQFLPSPGRISYLREPSGPGVRVDSGVYTGWTVPMDYDPLLAKLSVWGASRAQAIERLDRALGEYVVGGIRTNAAWFRRVLAEEDFQAGRLSTAFLDRALPALPEPDLETQAGAAIAAALSNKPASAQVSAEAPSRWLTAGREALLR